MDLYLPLRKYINLLILSIIFICFFASKVEAFSPLDFDKANQKYQKEDYDFATELYKKIIENQSKFFNNETHYNLGDAFFRQNDFENAEKEFLSTLNSKDLSLVEKALYNLGNTKFRQNDLKKSLEYYQRVLELNPKNQKAALNRDFVAKLLKEQEQNQQENQNNQQEQQQNSQQNQTNNQQEQNQSENQNQQQNQSTQQEQQQSQENQANNNQQQEQSENQQNQSENKNPQQQTSQNQQEISQQEAEQWLNTITDDPKAAIYDMVMRQAEKNNVKSGRDW